MPNVVGGVVPSNNHAVVIDAAWVCCLRSRIIELNEAAVAISLEATVSPAAVQVCPNYTVVLINSVRTSQSRRAASVNSVISWRECPLPAKKVEKDPFRAQLTAGRHRGGLNPLIDLMARVLKACHRH